MVSDVHQVASRCVVTLVITRRVIIRLNHTVPKALRTLLIECTRTEESESVMRGGVSVQRKDLPEVE